MWQDWVIAGVQAIIALSLIPTVRHATHKPTMSTSVLTATGMFILSLTFATLALWFATLMSAVIGALWTILAYQRYRLNVRDRNP